MRHLATFLGEQGFSVTDMACQGDDITFADNMQYLILPLPLTADGIHLNCEAEVKPSLVDIIQSIPCNTKVLAGCVSERAEDMLQQRGITWQDYYRDEKLLKGNAYLTAEATLQLVMQNINRSVKGAKVLITGSGRCGKEAARLFKKMGAKVTLTSRKRKDRVKTALIGIKPAKTADLHTLVQGADVIINTVPHPIFTECVLSGVKPETFVVELASSAAGVDLQAAADLGTNLLYAPSLPGRCLPFSAAEVICRTLTKIIREDSL